MFRYIIVETNYARNTTKSKKRIFAEIQGLLSHVITILLQQHVLQISNYSDFTGFPVVTPIVAC